MVRDLVGGIAVGAWGAVQGQGFGAAAVEGVIEVVRDEVTGFEEEVDVVRRTAVHAVGRVDPCGVLGSGPVQFWDDGAAEGGDGGLDGRVDVRPAGRGVGRVGVVIRVVGIGAVGFCIGKGAFAIFGGEDDAVGAKIG